MKACIFFLFFYGVPKSKNGTFAKRNTLKLMELERTQHKNEPRNHFKTGKPKSRINK